MPIDTLRGQQEQDGEQWDRGEIYWEVPSTARALPRFDDLFFGQSFRQWRQLEAWERNSCREDYSCVWDNGKCVQTLGERKKVEGRYALVSMKTTKVKIDDQWDIPTAV